MTTRAFCLSIISAAIGLVACSGLTSSVSSPASNQAPASTQNGAAPHILQSGEIGPRWKRFDPTSSGGGYSSIVAGPDGAMWAAENACCTNDIARFTMTGRFTQYALVATFNGMTQAFSPTELAVGADKNIYMIGNWGSSGCFSCYIGVFSPTTHQIAIYPLPSGDGTDFTRGIVLGPDGNVWIAASGSNAGIVKMTTTGSMTLYPYAGGVGPLASGPDGNVWFADQSGNVGKITPTGQITAYSGACAPQSLVNGQDGNLYFVSYPSQCGQFIGRVTTGGTITQYAISLPLNHIAQSMAVGSNGHIFVEGQASHTMLDFNPATNAMTTIAAPSVLSGTNDYGIASGPDGNLWSVDLNNNVVVYALDVLKVTPRSLTFTAIGQTATLTATETGSPTLTAKTKDATIATVTNGSTKNTFTVTAVGVGKTKIAVMDSIGNSFNVSVTVQ